MIDRWLDDSPKSGSLPSRNTVAAGMVVLDHLRRKIPVEESEVFSKGGELKSARTGLAAILEKYGVPSTYLKEVTTRQAGIVARRLFEA
ncbi:MAG: hypothetical protein SFV23_04840, partial [Planctomycetaceae bacterium]|nr:hypothetical protein [Planctomycetaceae bacterium]